MPTLLIRKLFLTLFLISNSFFIYAENSDSTSGSWNVHVRGDYGFVIAHRPALKPLQERHVTGIELSISKSTSGKKEWENIYHFPLYGITFAGFDLGSPSHLGYGLAVYPYIDFPLGKKQNSGLHFRYGMGLGYIEKVFNADENFKNSAAGSHLNGIIHFDLHYENKIVGRTYIEVGAGITHYSNGSISMPNLGLNIATVNLALTHSFGKNIPINRRTIPEKSKSPEIHIYVGGFKKKINPPLGDNFFACTLSGLRLKPFTNKSAWGIGADIFYDNSISERLERDGETTTGIDNFRAGIQGAYQLTVGHIGMMFNMGFYVYNPWKADGNAYHRICLRYYFEKIFLCFNLKSHYARADFVELGIGYRFIKKKK